MSIEVQGFQVEISINNYRTLRFRILRERSERILAAHVSHPPQVLAGSEKKDLEGRFKIGMAWAEGWITLRRKRESQRARLEAAYVRKQSK